MSDYRVELNVITIKRKMENDLLLERTHILGKMVYIADVRLFHVALFSKMITFLN